MPNAIIVDSLFMFRPPPTFATCVVYLNQIGKQELDQDLVKMTILSIAMKTTEQPRKVRDIINCCWYLLYQSIPPIDERMKEWKDSIGKFEFVIMRLLKFQLNVDTVYPHLTQLIHVHCKDEETNEMIPEAKQITLLTLSLAELFYKRNLVAKYYGKERFVACCIYTI